MRALRPLVALAVFSLARTTLADAPPSPSPSSSESEDRDAARAHFGRGVQLYRERDFRAALAEFNRAYALGPSYRILYNIGQAEVEAQDCPAAMKTFARYLEDGGAELAPERRAEVDKAVTTCGDRVAKITVRVTAPTADAKAAIFVDDVAVGTSPLAQPVVVSVGRRRVSVIAEGFPPSVRVVEVAGRDELDLDFTLVAAVRDEAPRVVFAPVLPPRAVAPSPSHTPFWVSLGVTGALGAATLATGLLSLSAKSSLQRELDTFPTDDAAVRSARTDLKTRALVTDILGVTALVGVGVTTYFALTTLKAPKSGPSVRVGLGAGSIAAEGKF